jgi:hypothetical protein
MRKANRWPFFCIQPLTEEEADAMDIHGHG